MKPARLFWPTQYTQSAWTPPPHISIKRLSLTACRSCSCGAPVYFSSTGPLHSQHEPKRISAIGRRQTGHPLHSQYKPKRRIEYGRRRTSHRRKKEQTGHSLHSQYEPKNTSAFGRGKTGHCHEKIEPDGKSDHRKIGTAQSLVTTSFSSPGAPLFQPDGTQIFNKLTAFLRAQYPAFGFHEVHTPTMHKQFLWEKSGHWANYKDDMFTVTGNSSRKPKAAPIEMSDGRMQSKKNVPEAAELEEYGLKPMNCPGHCLVFRSQQRSDWDLPIRYAGFSPLHQNEISGALSDLTKVRRFHQDDGHIFCRPGQVKKEIKKSLDFVRLVYQALGFRNYALVLSTRPENGYMGLLNEWNSAEDQMKEALDASGKPWSTNDGDGAFYGPKIDMIVQDSDGKRHQTATIQLDFQLPKQFLLGYDAPAPKLKAKGVLKLQSTRTITPVMIHLNVLGSLERFMALLLEHHRGQLPLWLSPRQVIILTVTDNVRVIEFAESLKNFLLNTATDSLPKQTHCPTYIVDVDDSADSISEKVVRAKEKKYNIICVVGNRNFASKKVQGKTPTVDVSVTAQPNQRSTWDAIEKIKPGSQAPIRKDRGVGTNFRHLGPGVQLGMYQCRELIRTLSAKYL